MPASSLDRHRRGIDADHITTQTRELLGEKPPSAADVEGPEPGNPAFVMLREHLAEVAEAAWSDAAMQALSGLVSSHHESPMRS
jgi:hypothetical protein